jgi:sugar phosphate isomerase/epimerase
MRLSFYTYSYLDKLQMPVAQTLQRIARSGYSGIDISGTYGASDDPSSVDADRRQLVRSTAERLNLRVEAIITHAQLTDTLVDPNRETLDLGGSIDLAADLRAEVVTFHMGGTPKAADRKTLWKQVVAVVRKAADHGAARHVALAVDGIWPVWLVDGPDTLQQLFDDVDHQNFGVNFDPSYLTLMDVDPARFVDRFHTRIVHAHLKDHRGSYPEWTHHIAGQGDMDYAPVLAALRKRKFEGSLAVECFTNMKLEEACAVGFAAMTKAAKEARVEFAD